jgi:hypothetical protein
MVCPVCTIAVAFGVGIMRGLGIDDVITGMWYGALIVSSILWMLDYMQRKNWRFPGHNAAIWISFIILFVGPLWWPMHLVGTDANGFFGLKLLLGMLIGGVIFGLAVLSERALRRLNQGKVVVYYQKVIIPLLYLILASVIAHFVLGIIG